MDDQPGVSILMILNSFLQNPDFNSALMGAATILIGLIVISGLISGSEIAFFSLNDAKVNSLKGKQSEVVRWLWNRPEKLLATILIYNNLVNISIIVLASWLSTYLFNFQYVWVKFLVDVVIITCIIVFFCELFPKVIANMKPVALANLMAKPLRFGMGLLFPLVILLVKSTVFIDRRLKKKGIDISREDLNQAINYSAKMASGDVEEARLLKGIINFGDKEVTEVMTSRIDTIAIDEQEEFGHVLEIIRNSGYSRYPVYRENMDQIIGVLHIKDVLPYAGVDHQVPWQEKVRPVYVIPENKKIGDLLKEFQKKKMHLAVVVDEFGGANGIVTLEDVIEEIVGDISDEFDEEEDTLDYRKIADNQYEFEGKVLINDFLKVLDIVDEYGSMAKGEADTLAGFLLEMKGDIPKKSEVLNHRNLRFTIKEVDHRRIKKIHIQYTPG
jgi:gliding motility-associated protein GldE